jgi:hypothetical protein
MNDPTAGGFKKEKTRHQKMMKITDGDAAMPCLELREVWSHQRKKVIQMMQYDSINQNK